MLGTVPQEKIGPWEKISTMMVDTSTSMKRAALAAATCATAIRGFRASAWIAPSGITKWSEKSGPTYTTLYFDDRWGWTVKHTRVYTQQSPWHGVMTLPVNWCVMTSE